MICVVDPGNPEFRGEKSLFHPLGLRTMTASIRTIRYAQALPADACRLLRFESIPMMTTSSEHDELPELTIRTYTPDDQAAVDRLYSEGLLAGQIDPNDTAADIESIEIAYFSEPHNHFWVAELEGKVVGMIGVVRDDEQSLGEIRRLRVDPDWQNSSVGATLIEVALAHCKHHGWLKVVLDTRFERNVALDLFSRFGFKHNRSRNVHGREMLEFYLDLYRRDEPG